MDIITNLPRYSDGEIDRAFMKEIVTGFKREKETEKERVKQAAKQSSGLRGTTHPTLGTIPAREFFRLTQKYGQETVHSKEFLKYYNKKFPELSPNKA